VTKHGNGGSTSVSGASNVLAAHGVKFSDDADTMRRSLDEANICYFHAPLFATGMKYVGPTRRALQVPTCFNLLGPLVNPCHPKNSLHGTATQGQLRLYTNLHQKIGDNYGVITSYDGYDEISLTSGFKICTNYFEKVYTPKELGFNYIKPEEIYGGETPEQAKAIFDAVLQGTATEGQKNVILANAACGITIMEPNLSIEETVSIARESLESGKALQTFKKFVQINS
jgi:anthranilate phosphoribosyltransferase